MMKTRIGILGYGNLGKGVELAARQNDDIELVAIFSRRDPSTITPLTAGVPVFSVDDIEAHTNDVDVVVVPQLICPNRRRNTPSSSTWSIRSTRTRTSRSTSQQLMRLRRRQVRLVSSR